MKRSKMEFQKFRVDQERKGLMNKGKTRTVGREGGVGPRNHLSKGGGSKGPSGQGVVPEGVESKEGRASSSWEGVERDEGDRPGFTSEGVKRSSEEGGGKQKGRGLRSMTNGVNCLMTMRP